MSERHWPEFALFAYVHHGKATEEETRDEGRETRGQGRGTRQEKRNAAKSPRHRGPACHADGWVASSSLPGPGIRSNAIFNSTVIVVNSEVLFIDMIAQGRTF